MSGFLSVGQLLTSINHMKLYVIKVSENWDYCGGGGVIIADDFEEAKKLLLNHSEEGETLYNTEEEVDKNYNCWIVVESFDIKKESKRVVSLEYNWA